MMMRATRIVWLTLLLAVTTSSCLWAVEAKNQRIRPAAVAGMFYPQEKHALKTSVQTFLEKAGGEKISGAVRALVAPHAGYVYSGIVAAAGYKQVDPKIRQVILLGPSHRVPLERPSIAQVIAYKTPLGEVPLAGLAGRLRSLADITSVAQAHEKEHSLEVQLPFLQVSLKDFEIVPILIREGDPERLATLLAPYIDDRTLVVASTDLSHYYPYDTAISLDRLCIEAVVSGNLSGMTLCQACGKEAVLTLMHLAEKKGWQGKLIDYKNSGNTAGDKKRVVGYAAIAFVDRKESLSEMNKDRTDLSDEAKKELIQFARSVIAARLDPKAGVQRPKQSCDAFFQERGCFVTLHKGGHLRGCIGSIQPVSGLVSCIEENAYNAAFRDPRFPSLTKEELLEIDLEISVLTVPEKIAFKNGEDLKNQIDPLSHGVILTRGAHRSTFLPQVWKQLPDKEKFLEHLCLKGGMAPNAWQDPKTTVEVYTAEVFGEKDCK